MKRKKKYVIPLLITFAVGGLAALLIRDSMESFSALKLPPFAPPGWVFPVVWTILYALMGIAAGQIIDSCSPGAWDALFWYGAQLFLNFWWPIIFFRWENRLMALFGILVLLVLAVKTALEFRKIRRSAFTLLLPYLLWLVYALILNASVYYLNR